MQHSHIRYSKQAETLYVHAYESYVKTWEEKLFRGSRQKHSLITVAQLQSLFQYMKMIETWENAEKNNKKQASRFHVWKSV